ncbi:MAG: TIGR03084 family metal-binding protein [Micromonosporaceae bacterium]
MTDAAVVFDDLEAEADELDRLVADLPDAGWATPTPAPGWSIAHQIAHLAWTDDRARLAAVDPDGFANEVQQAAHKINTYVDEGAEEGARLAPEALLKRWRSARAEVLDALRAVPPKTKLPWYGPPMGAASMASARLMETWAHGLDVADALGASREPTARLRHIAHLAARARDFSYWMRSEEPPSEPFRIELTGPGGEEWEYGPAEAAQRVRGPALDFCLLVTRRRHRADLGLRAEGGDAEHWLDIAQVFAGPPGAGRQPGQFG